jgi:MHS family proline/betaine transporter-like MFS transporter
MSDNAHVLHPDALHSDALHSEAPPVVKRSDAVRAITAGAIGHLIEWYDFVVYAYFASTIGSLFFPADNANLSLLLTFAVFGIGFIFRPLGSIVFGHIGDRNGRRNTLVAVIFTMTLSTGLIGLLPTYQQIGVAGPLLLIALRLIQGLAAGGEFGGASSFILEYAPENRCGYFGSYLFGMIGVSLVLGSATGTILNSALTDVQLKAWGWRIPFLISFVLGVVGFYIRMKLEDTPAYRAIARKADIAKMPFVEMMRDHWRKVVLVICLLLASAVPFYIYLIFMPTYMVTTLSMAKSQAYSANLISLIIYSLSFPIFGSLCDRIGRRPFMLGGSLLLALLSYPGFVLLTQTGASMVSVTAVLIGLSLCLSMYQAPLTAAFNEFFPTRVRYSAVGFGYAVGISVFGGFAPFIATYLLGTTGNIFSPAFMVIGASAITFVVVMLSVPETLGTHLEKVN